MTEPSAARLVVRAADFGNPQLNDLIETHRAFSVAQQVKSGLKTYSSDITALQRPDISVWTAWDPDAEQLLGCVALKVLGSTESDGALPNEKGDASMGRTRLRGEVKSMHTLAAARSRGVGGVLLDHVITQAQNMELLELLLQTSSAAAFDPASRLYKRYGFVECGPFADYVEGGGRVFMKLALGTGSVR